MSYEEEIRRLIMVKPSISTITRRDIYYRAIEHPELAPELYADLTGPDEKKITITRRNVGKILKEHAKQEKWIHAIPDSHTNPRYQVEMQVLMGAEV